ncbi:hypothetical protein ACN47E_004898 [Coniothyrium glycines]
MAAPKDRSIHNLSGNWKLNHALSDDIGAAMAVQGVNFILRTALSRAPISLAIEHNKDDATGLETIVTRQSTIGRTMEDQRPLNGEEVVTNHIVFGEVKSSAEYIAVGEITAERLKSDWENGTQELIQQRSQGKTWFSWQTWGFEVINGDRYHVRRTIIRKGHDTQDVSAQDVFVRMVYDWIGQ